jgi:biotin carboxyl carrier protein
MGPEVRLKPDATTDAQVGVIPDPAGGAGLASEVRRSLRKSHEVTVGADSTPGQLIVSVRSVPVTVSLNGRRRWGRKEQSGHIGPQRIVAPMPGKIVRILVKPGEAVRARQPLLVMEAMKMENELRASCDGAVAELHAREGQSVDAGALLAIVTPN